MKKMSSNAEEEIEKLINKFADDLKIKLFKIVSRNEKKAIKEHASQLKSKLGSRNSSKRVSKKRADSESESD